MTIILKEGLFISQTEPFYNLGLAEIVWVCLCMNAARQGCRALQNGIAAAAKKELSVS